MGKTVDRLASEIDGLPDVEKIQLVDRILAALHGADPKTEKVWAREARRRSASLKAGRSRAVSWETAMAKYRPR